MRQNAYKDGESNRTRGKPLVKVITVLKRSALVFVILCIFAQIASAFVWEIELPLPDYDSRWDDVKILWQKRWANGDIDQIKVLLHQLEKQYPGMVEPFVWLARMYCIEGHENKNRRQENYKTVEMYAAKALAIDKDNLVALKILVDALPNIENMEYTLENYGEWIRSAAPFPVGRLVPDMNGTDRWNEAITLWDQRLDLEKGVRAIYLFNKMADENPDNVNAQVWASRANYDIGQYYTSIGKHVEKAMDFYDTGKDYGERALALNRHSVPAHYWYQLNLARSIQYKSIFIKARYLTTLLDHMRFCMQENGLYNYYGPALALATMITNGGWVAEKGMYLGGVNVESVLNALDLAEVFYPSKLYVLYGKADILAYKGRKDEALKILETLFAKDPDSNPYIMLENRSVVNFARDLYDEIRKEN